jgi:hypothetical protein
MTIGVRVLIDTKDGNNYPIREYGYITRRLNAQLYEIWGESSQVTYLLSPQEFTEINTNLSEDLYGKRNKIR